jgi:hypothetical protein
VCDVDRHCERAVGTATPGQARNRYEGLSVAAGCGAGKRARWSLWRGWLRPGWRMPVARVDGRGGAA